MRIYGSEYSAVYLLGIILAVGGMYALGMGLIRLLVAIGSNI